MGQVKKPLKKRIRNVVSYVFSLFLALIFFLLFASIALRFGLFNDKATLARINESGYYNNVQEELYKNIKTITDEAKLPESVMSDVISLKRVYVNGKNYISNVLEGKEAKADTSKVEEELQKNIDEYLSKTDIKSSDLETVNPGTSQLVYQAAKEYKRMLEFPFVKYIKEYEEAFYHVIKWCIPVCVVLLVLIYIMLFRIHRYKHRIARYSAFGMLGATWMMLMAPLYLMISGMYQKISITPEYYDAFIHSYLKNGTAMFLYVGGVGMILSIALILLATYIKNNVTVTKAKHRL